MDLSAFMSAPVKASVPVVLGAHEGYFVPIVQSHDLLKPLYEAVLAGNLRGAAQCIMIETYPGSKDLGNLYCLLSQFSDGVDLLARTVQLVEAVFEVYGFSPMADFARELQLLRQAPQPTTVDAVVALIVNLYLAPQPLPLLCLSVFDGKLHIRSPSQPTYRLGALLGSGEYGSVFQCFQYSKTPASEGSGLVEERECAIKVMDVQAIAGKPDSTVRSVDSFFLRLEREFLIPSYIRHPNIVAYLDHVSHLARDGPPSSMVPAQFAGAKKYLVMELAGSELFDFMATLTPFEMRSITAQVGRALLYLHRLSPGIAHRDVKPENLAFRRLPDGSVQCQLFDFGMTRLIGNSHSQRGVTQCGTRLYLAPEILTRATHDTSVDVFSLGFTLSVMVGSMTPRRGRGGGLHPDASFKCGVVQYGSDGSPYFCCNDRGQPLFPLRDGQGLVMRDVQGNPMPRPCDGGASWAARFALCDQDSPPGTPSVRDLICGLCHDDPSRRLSLLEALQHPWFGSQALTREELAQLDALCLETNERRSLLATQLGGRMDVSEDDDEQEVLRLYGLL